MLQGIWTTNERHKQRMKEWVIVWIYEWVSEPSYYSAGKNQRTYGTIGGPFTESDFESLDEWAGERSRQRGAIIILYGVILHCAVLVLYGIVLRYIILYCVVAHYIILILYYSIWCDIILYYIYCVLLYRDVFYCTIPRWLLRSSTHSLLDPRGASVNGPSMGPSCVDLSVV